MSILLLEYLEAQTMDFYHLRFVGCCIFLKYMKMHGHTINNITNIHITTMLS